MNNKKNRIYLHIGTHKTGSTLIQNALAAKSNDLIKENIKYLEKPKFFYAGLQNLKGIDKSFIKLVKKEVHEAFISSGCSNLAISNEALSGDYNIGYENVNNIAQNLGNALKDYEVKIIIYIRRQDDFVESMYTQKIHIGESLTFDEYIKNINKEYYNWYNIINSYAQYFGKDNIFVKIYHKKYYPKAESILYDFSHTIGSNSLVYYQGNKTPNRGYSRTAMEIARLVNPYLTGKPQKKALRIFLQTNYPKDINESYGYFDKNSRMDFYQKYLESNKRIQQEYFGSGSQELFPLDDFDKDLFEFSLQKKDMAKVLGLFINQILTNKPAQNNQKRNHSLNLFNRAKRKLNKIINK